ncbi:MAG: hypothetical protein ACHQD8_01390 [Chitinophagales bacterium]
MKSDTIQSPLHYSNVMLTGAILLANTDVNGLINYTLKAALGGAIWLGYKIAADAIDRKRKQKDNERNN